MDQLRKYKDYDNIYITFVQKEKVGINPNYLHGTPIGVYAYPLKDSWTRYKMEENGLDKIPFAGNRQFIYVIRLNSSARVLVGSKYNKNTLKIDIVKLREIAKKYKIDEKDFDSALHIVKMEFPEDEIDYFSTLYHIIFELCKLYAYSFSSRTSFANKVYNLLGYDAILDDEGSIDIGWIYQQIGFLNPKSYKVIDKVENKELNISKYIDDRTKEYKGDWIRGIWKDGIFNGGTWESDTWINGIWKKGTWKGKYWWDGTWLNGTWERGI